MQPSNLFKINFISICSIIKVYLPLSLNKYVEATAFKQEVTGYFYLGRTTAASLIKFWRKVKFSLRVMTSGRCAFVCSYRCCDCIHLQTTMKPKMKIHKTNFEKNGKDCNLLIFSLTRCFVNWISKHGKLIKFFPKTKNAEFYVGSSKIRRISFYFCFFLHTTRNWLA